MQHQPQPTDPNHVRYSNRTFPPYRFVPGRHPHPRLDPNGHSHNQPEPAPAPIAPDDWHTSDTYLYGIDLFNFAYWWECHEELEALWHVLGHDTEQGAFLQGLIQVAAANLRRFMAPDDPAAGTSLVEKAMEKLHRFDGFYMGIDVVQFRKDIEAYHRDGKGRVPTIELHFPHPIDQ